MNSAIKVIVGIIIGALGFWLVQPQLGDTPAASNEASVEATSRVVESLESDAKGKSDTSAQPSTDETLSSEKKLRRVEAELARVRQELSRVQQASTKNYSPARQPLQKADQTNRDDEQGNDYLAGISEDYHQLLDPPKRRKDLPELHEDFVDEEADLSWALAMEQQIRNFKENHANSGYLLDFSIQCKATMCEMFAKMDAQFMEQWDELYNDMVAQGWWEFTGTSSSGTTIADDKTYINVKLLQRTTG